MLIYLLLAILIGSAVSIFVVGCVRRFKYYDPPVPCHAWVQVEMLEMPVHLMPAPRLRKELAQRGIATAGPDGAVLSKEVLQRTLLAALQRRCGFSCYFVQDLRVGEVAGDE